MGLSKKREKTNLMTLRAELSRLAMNGSGVATEIAERPADPRTPQSKPVASPILQEAKRRGKRKNALIDGAKLLTC